MATRHRVLVTGAFGLVGTAVVTALVDHAHAVTVTDLDLPAHRSQAADLAKTYGVAIRWADLTDPDQVRNLIESVRPTIVVHLAAIIPPFCYTKRDLARQVNVDATAHLIATARSLAAPPRFVLASSVAVYGARNPHRNAGLLTATTPCQPSDLYGAHKVAAENLVTQSGLEWVVLRLGGVLTAQPRWRIDPDLVFFETVLPSDGRIQTVDVRDVARAFAAATTTTRTGATYLIGGDDTHRTTQATISADTAAAMGISGGLPPGRPGNPAEDSAWFATDWMDTAHAQNVLNYQQHSLPQMYAQLRNAVGWRRPLLGLTAPVLRRYLERHSPLGDVPGRYADPWALISGRWGNPEPDRPQ